MPVISHFTKDNVVFEDGTSVSDVGAVILGTGYEWIWPYLSPPHGNALLVNRDDLISVNSTTARKLTTNTKYIFPLWNYLFSVSPNLPPTALAFIGLSEGAPDAVVGSLLGLLIAHSLANASLLPSRETMLSDVIARENLIRSRGLNPYKIGHFLVSAETDPFDFQENIASWLRDRGVPVRTDPDTGNFVDAWRHGNFDDFVLVRSGWERIQRLGEVAKWLTGVESLDQWGALLRRIVNWEKTQEETEKEDSSC